MDRTSDSLCPGCFAAKGPANPCPHCGYDVIGNPLHLIGNERLKQRHRA